MKGPSVAWNLGKPSLSGRPPTHSISRRSNQVLFFCSSFLSRGFTGRPSQAQLWSHRGLEEEGNPWKQGTPKSQHRTKEKDLTATQRLAREWCRPCWATWLWLAWWSWLPRRRSWWRGWRGCVQGRTSAFHSHPAQCYKAGTSRTHCRPSGKCNYLQVIGWISFFLDFLVNQSIIFPDSSSAASPAALQWFVVHHLCLEKQSRATTTLRSMSTWTRGPIWTSEDLMQELETSLFLKRRPRCGLRSLVQSETLLNIYFSERFSPRNVFCSRW